MVNSIINLHSRNNTLRLLFMFCMHVIRTLFMFMNKKLPQRGVALEERAKNQGGEYTLTLL